MTPKPQPPFPPQPLSEPGLESRMDPKPRYQAGAYQPAGKLGNKVALITGGDSGIGRAVALMFAREGADIALAYLAEEESDAGAISEDIEALGQIVLLIPGDVSDPEFCRSAVDKVIARFDRLDILINNAAYQKHRDSLEDISLEQWEHTFRVNIFGYFYMARFAASKMKPGSSIINTGSITGTETLDFVVFASNADSSYITGHVLPQLGGDTIGS